MKCGKPAKVIVHGFSHPVPMCPDCAAGAMRLAAHMGFMITTQPADDVCGTHKKDSDDDQGSES